MKFFNFLNNFFKKNLDKKLIAFCTALLLWFYVDTSSTIKKEFRAKISYKNIPKKLIPLKSPRTISYFVIGNKYFSTNLKSPNVVFEVSLKDAKEGFNIVNIKPVLKSKLSYNIHLEPSKETIKVFMDKKISKKVKIKANINHSLSPDYKVASLSVSPSFVLVEGAKSLVNSVKFLETKAIHVLQPDIYQLKRKVISPSDELKIIPKEVNVDFRMAANRIEQKIYLPLKTKNLAENLKVKKISVTKAFFKVKGLYSQIKKLDFKNLFYYIDVKDLSKAGVYQLSLPILYSKTFEIIPIKIKKVKVVLIERGQHDFKR